MNILFLMLALFKTFHNHFTLNKTPLPQKLFRGRSKPCPTRTFCSCTSPCWKPYFLSWSRTVWVKAWCGTVWGVNVRGNHLVLSVRHGTDFLDES